MGTPGLPQGALVAGRYRLEGPLGAGGMSWVFRATDLHLDRPVAIKVLRDSAIGHAERLEREARAAARLQHPAVVGIYDLGQLADQRPYLVLEFIEGRTLTAVLAGGPLSPARAVHLLAPVAGALGEAHRRGIVHRDLKPDNLMLEELTGSLARLRLLDFGIAALTEPEDGTRFTRDGAVFGTPEFMAPEQALGQKPSPATDVWALGVVLHTMLTGRPPFPGKHAPEILFKITQKEPERLPTDVPAPLVALVADCLRKDPTHRPVDGTAFLARLDAWAAPATSIGRPPRSGWPWWVAAVGTVAGLGLGLVLAPQAVETAVVSPPVAAPATVAPVVAQPASASPATAAPAALDQVEGLVDANPAAALAWLEAHPDAGRPTHRLRLRGLARLGEKEVAAGLADLAASLAGDPAGVADARLVPALTAVLDHKDAEPAVALLAGPLAAQAAAALHQVAAEGGSRARWRAVDALEKGGSEATSARFAALLRDLKADDCERRKKAARQLGRMGNPAALADLRKAAGRGFLDNFCMDGTLDAAIRELKGKP